MCSVKTRGNALCGAKAVVLENGVAKCGRHKANCLLHSSFASSSILGATLEAIPEEEEEPGPSEEQLEAEMAKELELSMAAMDIEEKEVEEYTGFEGPVSGAWRNTEIDPSQLEAFLFSTSEHINEQAAEAFIQDVDDCLLHYR